MPKTTKKSERAALAKLRRSIRRKMTAKQAAKTEGPGNRKAKSHPHRRTSALR